VVDEAVWLSNLNVPFGVETLAVLAVLRWGGSLEQRARFHKLDYV
jgi:hypothetical protein